MMSIDFKPHTRVIFGAGALSKLGEVARELEFRRTLLVADDGLVAAGHVAQAIKYLKAAQVEVVPFHDFNVNPDSAMVEHGCAFAASYNVDSIIGLGGGSSLDCAKGINLLLTNGGRIQDYWGYDKTARPMLPMIGVPTTAGTGSEAQTYALISDAETHAKMACGASGAAFRVTILDPELTISQPRDVTATSGFDAISHAVETYVTTKRNMLSDAFAREAWVLLEENYERVLVRPEDIEARGAMQLGAYLSGLAIENSMLGAAHACANPLTARYGKEHGAALAILLPSVIKWNERAVGERYEELLSFGCKRPSGGGGDGEGLALRIEELIEAGGLTNRLSRIGIAHGDLRLLAEEAAGQWTGRFNPRPFDAEGALEVYEWAF